MKADGGGAEVERMRCVAVILCLPEERISEDVLGKDREMESVPCYAFEGCCRVVQVSESKAPRGSAGRYGRSSEGVNRKA